MGNFQLEINLFKQGERRKAIFPIQTKWEERAKPLFLTKKARFHLQARYSIIDRKPRIALKRVHELVTLPYTFLFFFFPLTLAVFNFTYVTTTSIVKATGS